MELTENVDYTHDGWREGQPAWVDAPPLIVRLHVVRESYEAWHEHVQSVAALRTRLWNAWYALLTEEQKAERSAKAEAQMMREAQQWYAAQPPGSNKSFWD